MTSPSYATLNGNRVTAARLTIPAWGASFHDVTIDGEVTISGACTLTVADLTIKCTVLSGGPASGKSFYRLVAGAGGWGNTIDKKAYANDAGVKLSTVLGDAAAAVGEALDTSTIDGSARLGPAWVRKKDPACRVLELVSPNAWYVGEDGKTRLGGRPSSTLTATAAQTSQLDLARATVTLASDTIAGILPGLQISGLTAVDVEHTLSADGGLRSQIWGQLGSGMSRRLAAMRAIVDQLDPSRAFRGTYEYRVVNLTGNRLNLQPVRVSTGMPDLSRVPVRPGVPGCFGPPALGSLVLVTFVNADPSRPAVVGFDDPDAPGFSPQSLALGGPNGNPVARLGDQVTVFLPPTLPIAITAPSPMTGTITVASPITGIITGGSALNTSP